MHFLPLFALYNFTISFNAALDWSILRCIFHLLMAPTLLPVLRSLEFSSVYISILDCTPSPTLFALASHNRVECSSRLEHLTVYDLAHSSFADDTNHAARFVVVGISSAHVDILDCTLSDTLCALSSHHRLQFSSILEHQTP